MSEKMTGFIKLAESYQLLLDKRSGELSEDQINNIKKEIEILRIVGDMTEKELCFLFDTSAFNDIVKGYVAMTCDDLDYSTDQTHDLLQRLGEMFDFHNAEHTLNYWKNLYY